METTYQKTVHHNDIFIRAIHIFFFFIFFFFLKNKAIFSWIRKWIQFWVICIRANTSPYKSEMLIVISQYEK